MHDTLKLLLVLFVIYGAIGLFPLYWASNARSRLEQGLSGAFLIYYASFLLTTFALTGSVTDKLPEKEVLELTGLDSFNQYMLMFGFFFTFLLGGVGTNVITDALRNKNEQSEMLAAIKRIEDRLDNQFVEPTKRHKVFLHIAVSISVIMFGASVVYLILG